MNYEGLHESKGTEAALWSHPTSLLSALNKGGQISEFFCNVKKNDDYYLLRIKGLGN